jgi:monoamine oxidase
MGRIKVPSGLIGVLAPLIRALPDCAIKYCKPVSKIMWGGGPEAKDGRVRVLCCDGDIFCCDYAIITPSLGVLKKHKDDMFSPPLPDYKKDAIDKLGYGYQTNIYLMYDKPFWLKGKGNLKLCWSLGELKERGDWIRAAPAITEDSPGITIQTVSLQIHYHPPRKCGWLGDVLTKTEH